MGPKRRREMADKKPGGTPMEQLEAPSLTDAIAMIDKTFGVAKLMADEGKYLVEPYYKQSQYGYEKVHSEDASMHVALLPEHAPYNTEGFYAQPEAVSAAITALGARRVLELGCGQAFNSRYLARKHPEVEFVGLDLMPHHVKKARERGKALTNVSFHEGSYEEISPDLGQFDVIFAVETLCYADHPGKVAEGVMAHLNPGGRFLMHDGFRKAHFSELPEDMQLAQRLYEIGVVVQNGFYPEGAWQQAFAAAGMQNVKTEDLTRQTKAGLSRLLRIALKFFNSPKYRLAAKVMPTYLVRNAASGLLGPYIILGDPNKPDFDSGSLVYQLITADKPA